MRPARRRRKDGSYLGRRSRALDLMFKLHIIKGTHRFAVCVAVITGIAVAQNNEPQISAKPFVGCYQLHLGRWWPWGFGDDSSFVSVPRTIELLSERGKDGFEKNEFLVRAIPATASSRRKSYWRPTGDTKVSLFWTDGFTGVTVNLEKDEGVLSGWAHPHFDTPMLVSRFAHAVATPIWCEIARREQTPATN